MASTKPKATQPTSSVERSANIMVGTREVELILTTRATRLIATRCSGRENLGQTPEVSENPDGSLAKVVWLITFLANQSI